MPIEMSASRRPTSTPPRSPLDATHDLPLTDLHEVVGLGLDHGRALLTADELAVADRILSLRGPPGRLYARLTVRKPSVFRVDELAAPGVDDPHRAVDVLVRHGLLADGATWAERIEVSTRPTLAQWCRLRGVPRSGRKAALQARLVDVADVPATQRWTRVGHRGLVRRLERLAFLDKEPDRGVLVAARRGHVAWPDYTCTDGPPVFADRRALVTWEALWDAMLGGRLTTEAALLALELGAGRAPGRLSLERRLVDHVRDAADALGRADRADEGLALLDALVGRGGVPAELVAMDRSRLHERAARPLDALAVLDAARDVDRPALRLAIHRSGRRLARATRRSWAPDPPLREARRRSLAMPAGEGRGPRPTWRVDDREYLVEDAVVAMLRQAGRAAVRCEGGLIRTLFVLLFADALFLPVHGALPVPRLSGPLDLGRPDFAPRRPDAVAEILAAVSRGEAPTRIDAACAAWRGVRLGGVSRSLDTPEPLVAAAHALGPAGLHTVLEPLLAHGWRATRGLPDLLVLDGPGVVLHAHPSRLPAGGRLVEVKGPGDTLRDGQRIWHDRLVRAGVPVETWDIRPT